MLRLDPAGSAAFRSLVPVTPEHETEYQVIFDNAIVGIVYTRDRRILRCNRRFEEMFGYAPGSLDDCDLRVLYASDEDYARIGQRGHDTVCREQVYADERVMMRSTGERFWCGVTGRALDRSHPFQDAVWIVIDISKRKQAEAELLLAREDLERRVQERTRELRESNEALRVEMAARQQIEQELIASREKYRVLFETVPVGIAITDAADNVIEINRTQRRFSTLASLATITRELGTRGLSLTDADGKPFERRQLPSLRAKQERRVISPVEIGIRYASGRQRWFNVAAAPIPVAGYGAVVVHAEITERKRFEEKARAQQAELARVSRINTMGEMAAALAHELGQPLVSTLNFLHGCRIRLEAEDFDPASFRSAIDQATRCAEQAADIVGHVRQFVRRNEPETRPTDLNALITETLSFLDFERRQSEVQFRLALSAELPLLPLAPVEITQVLGNLVRNALEAMSETPVAERILEVSTQCDGKQRALITVSDRGSGISKKDASKIFTPFFTTKRNGIGLGLAVCQSVVQSHGGDISMTRNSHGGAAFRIALPMRK